MNVKIGLAIISLFLTMLFSASNAEEDKVGGITVGEWNAKCLNYFHENGQDAPEKAFFVHGYCEKYVCQKYGNSGYGMRIDECPEKVTDGMSCKKLKSANVDNLQFPDCCPKYKCFAKRDKKH